MGCAGNAAARTPNLDRVAAEGVRFTRCSTNSPLCMPARVSLISGQHVSQHGIWGNNLVATDRHGPSHVRNIRDAGYRTAVIGKTHLWANHKLDGHTRDHEHILKDWGYEYAHELRDVVPSSRCDCYYADFLAERGSLHIYQDYARTYWRGFHPWETPPCQLPLEEHIDIYCANRAAEWITNYQDEEPFYLQVCFTGPHTPFDSTPAYRYQFKPEEMPLCIMDPPAKPVSPQVQRQLKQSRLQEMTESQSRMMTSFYYAKVCMLDYGIGLVLQALEKRGMLDNTWIIYTSDHGEMLGDHRLNQKNVFYESALNVPLIIRPPGGTQALQASGLTDHLDVCATLIDAAKAEPLTGSSGVSLLPKLAGGSYPDKGKDVVFSEVKVGAYYAMGRDENYKMTIDSVTQQPVELYDMVSDPRELANLVNEPSLGNLRDEFMDEYFSQLLANHDEAKRTIYDEAEHAPLTETFMHELMRRSP
jgi:choline-sulfatase|tara:strand:- start:7989 stop:9413 length:1425 start_codon:yes stop_codon:yes gene_type:complete